MKHWHQAPVFHGRLAELLGQGLRLDPGERGRTSDAGSRPRRPGAGARQERLPRVHVLGDVEVAVGHAGRPAAATQAKTRWRLMSSKRWASERSSGSRQKRRVVRPGIESGRAVRMGGDERGARLPASSIAVPIPWSTATNCSSPTATACALRVLSEGPSSLSSSRG